MISVLNNLIQNSIKLTKQDEKIKLKIKESEGKHIFTKKDNEDGIAEANKETSVSDFV